MKESLLLWIYLPSLTNMPPLLWVLLDSLHSWLVALGLIFTWLHYCREYLHLQMFTESFFWSCLEIDLQLFPFLGKFLYFNHTMVPSRVFIAMILLSGKIASRLPPLRKGFPVRRVMVSMILLHAMIKNIFTSSIDFCT